MPDSTFKSKLLQIFGVTWPDSYDSPIWTLHMSPLIALVSVGLSETVWKSGFAHGLCLGLAAGQLAVLCIVSLQIRGITLRNPPDADAGIQQLHLSR